MNLDLGFFFLMFILVMSVILHEVAHGYVAYLAGDPTAYREGRLTLNPVPHIDPMMTILVPIMTYLSLGGLMFGGAKPVPVNTFLLKRWPRDWILVSIAGVAVNFAIAAFLAGVCQLPFLSWETRTLVARGAGINLLLGVFNLVPIPPLDGSRAFRFLLPRQMRTSYDRLEPFGFIIILVLLMTGMLGVVIVPVVAFLAALLQLPLRFG